jgi:dihydropteroate synthase
MERVGGLTTIPVMVNLPGLAGSPAAGRCLVMGVVNVTPDSFSDGGQWFDAAAAVEHGLELIAQGADIVDVGGESTRPGAQRVPVDEELRRVKPVITELVRAGAVVSVDTMRAQVAEWAVEAGVSLVNDVSGGLADPYMPRLVGKAGIPYVVVHWRGHSHDMNSRAIYADVVREVHDELAQRIEAVTAEGVDPSMIVLDPGLGFSKNPAAWGPDAHNWQLLAGLPELAAIGGRDFPVLVGASRKRHLSRLFDTDGGASRPFFQNDAATAAVTAISAAAGAWCARVHDVPANAAAVRVAAAYRAAGRA